MRMPATAARARTELELQLTLGPALMMTRGYASAEAAAAYRRAHALCDQVGDSPEALSALWRIHMFHLIRGELHVARATAEQLLAATSRMQNVDLLVEAHLAVGAPLLYQGRLADGRRHLEDAIARFDPERYSRHAFVYGQDPLVVGLSYLAWVLMLQGNEFEALASLERASRRAEVIGHDFSRAFALYFAAVVSDLREDFGVMLEYAERLIALADERQFPFWRVGGMALRGRALAAQGRHAEGLELMTTGLELSRAASAGAATMYFLRNIADAFRAIGSVDEALGAVAEGLDACERQDNRSGESELHRIRGELLAADPATSGAAEESFRRALALAREQGSILYARRAAAGLAAYLRDRGRVAEAEQVLAEVMERP